MEKILIKEPEWYSDAPKTSLTQWEQQGPISISEMVTKSGIDIKDLESDDIEIRKDDFEWFYDYGMFKKDALEAHGIVRQVDKYGKIYECML